ncbi:hypothetical protein FGO68_gene1761 [Halteria grandinella]|uniref:Uncharacterized protein n=1 Tax=Halteria grandinella TaxID=5974 RepID=A0A8J8P8Z1_HALGN|nr:hypothetical protein FGO68_gene1761 [Halteria grandinella]
MNTSPKSSQMYFLVISGLLASRHSPVRRSNPSKVTICHSQVRWALFTEALNDGRVQNIECNIYIYWIYIIEAPLIK